MNSSLTKHGNNLKLNNFFWKTRRLENKKINEKEESPIKTWNSISRNRSIISNFPTVVRWTTVNEKTDISWSNQRRKKEKTEREKRIIQKERIVSKKKSLIQTRGNRETIANSRNNRGEGGRTFIIRRNSWQRFHAGKKQPCCLLQPLAHWYLKRTASFSSEIPFAGNLGKNLCRGA